MEAARDSGEHTGSVRGSRRLIRLYQSRLHIPTQNLNAQNLETRSRLAEKALDTHTYFNKTVLDTLARARLHAHTHTHALITNKMLKKYGVATISRLLEMIGLFCKRAL